ncbi:MAG: hypothetical protein J7M12_03590 [Candidatus Hydrogenedentes bacterium]|nr:hypothetical protein [Candidatus Hydrogenedentota bacterium]
MKSRDKKSEDKQRHPAWFWFFGSTFGRRVSLTVLLGVLMVMVVWLARCGGYVGDSRATILFWLAFLGILLLIVAISVIDMLMIRLRFMVEHKRLVEKTFSDVQLADLEADRDKKD